MAHLLMRLNPVTAFLHDRDFARVQKVDSSGTTRYVHDGASVVAEADGSGNLTKTNTPGIGFTLAGTRQTYYWMQDALGSTTGVQDATQSRVDWMWYQAYGYTYVNRASVGTAYLFGGKHGYYADGDSGMLLLGRRYYLPSFHRFLTQDPSGHDAGLNLYQYAGNNPLTNVDPTGLDDDPVDQGIRNGFTTGFAMVGMFGGGIAGGTAGSIVPFAGTAAGVGIGSGSGALLGTAEGRMWGELAVGLRHLGNYLFSGSGGGGSGSGGGGTEVVNFVRSKIRNNPFAIRQAQAMSSDVNAEVNDLVKKFMGGNDNPGLGTRSLGDGFFELRGRGAGRVILKMTGRNTFDIAGKFTGHAGGDEANSAIIQRLMGGYKP